MMKNNTNKLIGDMLSMLILNVLSEGDESAVVIGNQIESRSCGELVIKPGTLLPPLIRLQKEGIISQHPNNQRQAMDYHLEEKGTEYLRELRTVYDAMRICLQMPF